MLVSCRFQRYISGNMETPFSVQIVVTCLLRTSKIRWSFSRGRFTTRSKPSGLCCVPSTTRGPSNISELVSKSLENARSHLLKIATFPNVHCFLSLQIVAYLQQHAAPQISQRVPVLPETVADQVRLWERDRNRVQQVKAVLYEEFPSQVSRLDADALSC